jgi:hypothetical protein
MMVALPLFYDTKHWQISILILLQLLEMGRFLATKPYQARWRNVYRFVLESTLLCFFITVFALGFII